MLPVAAGHGTPNIAFPAGAGRPHWLPLITLFGMPMTSPSPDTIDLSSADHMGDLARGGTNWSVHLETRQDGPVTAGRVHFVAGDVRRSSAWIFREWTVPDVRARFAEFSPLELWRLLESLS